jgi:hypothetical protein
VFRHPSGQVALYQAEQLGVGQSARSRRRQKLAYPEREHDSHGCGPNIMGNSAWRRVTGGRNQQPEQQSVGNAPFTDAPSGLPDCNQHRTQGEGDGRTTTKRRRPPYNQPSSRQDQKCGQDSGANLRRDSVVYHPGEKAGAHVTAGCLRQSQECEFRGEETLAIELPHRDGQGRNSHERERP